MLVTVGQKSRLLLLYLECHHRRNQGKWGDKGSIVDHWRVLFPPPLIRKWLTGTKSSFFVCYQCMCSTNFMVLSPLEIAPHDNLASLNLWPPVVSCRENLGVCVYMCMLSLLLLLLLLQLRHHQHQQQQQQPRKTNKRVLINKTNQT